MYRSLRELVRSPIACARALDALVQGSANEQRILNEINEKLAALCIASANELGGLNKIDARLAALLAASAEGQTVANLTHEKLQALLVEPARRDAPLSVDAPANPDVARKHAGVTLQAERLAENGLIVVPQFLAASETSELRSIADAIYEAMSNVDIATLSAIDASLAKNFQQWKGVKFAGLPAYLVRVAPALAARHQDICRIVIERTRRVFGGDWILYPERSYFRRQRVGKQKTQWHIDADAAALNRRDCFNVWLPLDAVGQNLPSLEIVPGSHATMKELPLLKEKAWRDDEFVYAVGASRTPILDPGDALAFDQFTLHRTQLVDTADFVRTSCEFRFVPA